MRGARASSTSTATPSSSADAKYNVVAYDFGVKHNILRMLAERGCDVTVVPAQTPAPTGARDEPRWRVPVQRSRRSGALRLRDRRDPRHSSTAKIPTFGICLGHQLLGLAVGAKTLKMKFGHHGANHPVIDLDSGRVMITSQNHGFAVDEASLPANARVTHRSLFDGSNQGIALTDAPAFSFQGHPEASPGPHDVGAAVRPLHRCDGGTREVKRAEPSPAIVRRHLPGAGGLSGVRVRHRVRALVRCEPPRRPEWPVGCVPPHARQRDRRLHHLAAPGRIGDARDGKRRARQRDALRWMRTTTASARVSAPKRTAGTRCRRACAPRSTPARSAPTTNRQITWLPRERWQDRMY